MPEIIPIHCQLFAGHTTSYDPHAVAVADWTGEAAEHPSTPGDIPTPPNHLDQPHLEPSISTSCRPPDDISPNEDKPAIRSARHTLITAITKRIAQQRLTAAQTAAVLHLTGPKVTKLLQTDIDEFTLDELIDLLPALQLSLQVAPASAHDNGHSRHKDCPND